MDGFFERWDTTPPRTDGREEFQLQERSRSLRMVEDENRIVCLDCRPEKNYEIIFLVHTEKLVT